MCVPPVMNTIKYVISEDDNAQRVAPFCIEEFKEAVFSMQAYKCRGPYGLPWNFTNIFGRYVVQIYSKSVVLGLQIVKFQHR